MPLFYYLLIQVTLFLRFVFKYTPGPTTSKNAQVIARNVEFVKKAMVIAVGIEVKRPKKTQNLISPTLKYPFSLRAPHCTHTVAPEGTEDRQNGHSAMIFP